MQVTTGWEREPENPALVAVKATWKATLPRQPEGIQVSVHGVLPLRNRKTETQFEINSYFFFGL